MEKKKFEYNIEALRGFAALLVVLTHCFGFSKVLDNVNRKGLLLYDFPGHLAVLIFFILSGYVIGLSTKTKILWNTSMQYIKKRFIRLYPIYIMCILIAICITNNKYRLDEIFYNMIFLQNIAADSLYEVGVVWSLNYEVIFYLLFIPISIYSIQPSHALILSLVFGLFFQYVIVNQQVAMYAFGFCFWLSGLWLSNNTVISNYTYSKFSLYGIFFIILSFASLNFSQDVLRYNLYTDNINGRYTYSATAIMLSDFSYLPLGIISICYFSNKKIWFCKYALMYVILNPLMYIFLLLYKGNVHEVGQSVFLVNCVLYLTALLFLVLGFVTKKNADNRLNNFFINTGSISYGLYMIHFVFIVLIGRLLPSAYGYMSFLVKIVIVFVFTFLSSYILEKIWQPFVVKIIRR